MVKAWQEEIHLGTRTQWVKGYTVTIWMTVASISAIFVTKSTHWLQWGGTQEQRIRCPSRITTNCMEDLMTTSSKRSGTNANCAKGNSCLTRTMFTSMPIFIGWAWKNIMNNFWVLPENKTQRRKIEYKQSEGKWHRRWDRNIWRQEDSLSEDAIMLVEKDISNPSGTELLLQESVRRIYGDIVKLGLMVNQTTYDFKTSWLHDFMTLWLNDLLT